MKMTWKSLAFTVLLFCSIPLFLLSQQDTHTGRVWSTATITIAHGTKALATSAITTGTCSTAQTDTATGTLTTDVIDVTVSADPTATTGYTPSTNGALQIVPYPTAGTVNFKVCNLTLADITPGSVSVNWAVRR